MPSLLLLLFFCGLAVVQPNGQRYLQLRWADRQPAGALSRRIGRLGPGALRVYAGNLADISPANITKLEVPKDAAATAIYGALNWST